MRVCPECDTPQSESSPFCQNCGYRLRSAQTALEGMPAISADMLLSRKLRRPENVATAEELKPAQADASDAFDRGRRRTAQGGAALPTEEAARARKTSEEPALPEALHASASAADRAAAPAARLEAIAATSPAGVRALDPGAVPSAARVQRLGGRAPLSYGVIGVILGLGVGFVGGSFIASQAGSGGRGARDAAAPSRVAIPAGTYTRGLSEEKRSVMIQTCYKVDDDPDANCEQDKLLKGEYPEVRQEVAAYHMDATEVTVAEYQACVEDGACEAVDYKGCKVYTNLGLQIALRVPRALQESDVALTCVTRDQAAAYCAFAGGQLPTHDQWERAARGDEDGRLFPWGDTWSSTYANWGELDVIKSSIVGKVDGVEWVAPPGYFRDGDSPFGMHDMAGNVAEWVRAEAGRPGEGVARGGSWASDPFALRVTGRLRVDPSRGRSDVGMRCVSP